MTSESMYLVAGAVGILSTVQYFVRRGVARATAERWLSQHGYRVKSFRVAWFRTMGLSSFYRNTDRAFDFIVEVVDRQLGGTGKVRLRVWTDWVGMVGREVEVDWIEMPSGGAGDDRPLMDRLADAQLDILRRVSAGETAFYAPRSSEQGVGDFDETVEHINALETRGMLTGGTPVEDGRPGRGLYSSVGSLAITPEGRRWLESQQL